MEKDYLKDISEIRSIMEKSSRFISLSGLSGVLAGVYALIGAFVAYKIAYKTEMVGYSEQVVRNAQENTSSLILVALAVLALTIVSGVILTRQKARQQGLKSWGPIAQKLVVNLAIPVIAGGVLILILYNQGHIGLIAPTTLIFYGLGLINASHYTYKDIRYLGLSEVVLGLIAASTVGYGLLIWAIGFGLLHIIYGGLMHFKYER